MIGQNKGFHPVLEEDHPYIFVDSCVQIWPDADFGNAHRHGATAYGVTAMPPHADTSAGLENVMYWRLIARQYPNIIVAEKAEDIRRAKSDGKAALVISAQDGGFIGDRIHRVEAFYRLGLRVMILAYNRTNNLGDGCLDRTDCGLTRFGELVVDECNRVGLLLDCTHMGRRTTMEIMERSRQPVIYSHSNPKRLVDNPRNIDDEQIRACAAKGGVIGLASWGPLVFKQGASKRPTVDDYLEHVDYVAQLLGSTDNIGIGTDMSLGTYPDHWHDPWGEPTYKDVASAYNKIVTTNVRSRLRAVEGFSSYPEIHSVIAKLLQKGYTEQDVAKILGENYLRVYAQVWK
jgi:membrane dipeptidase